MGEKRATLEQEAAKLREREREVTAQRENVGHELARLQERSENLQKEYDTILSRLWEEYELTRREAEEVGEKIEDLPSAQRRLQELKNKIKALGAVNVGAVVEYQEVSQRYEFLKTQIGDSGEIQSGIAGLDPGSDKAYAPAVYRAVPADQRKLWQDLPRAVWRRHRNPFLTDDSDVLTSGIEIKVHPPGKIVTHIESLSGGEKALVAISIYFAIMRVNPRRSACWMRSRRRWTM